MILSVAGSTPSKEQAVGAAMALPGRVHAEAERRATADGRKAKFANVHNRQDRNKGRALYMRESGRANVD
jgi:hypothetical protein